MTHVTLDIGRRRASTSRPASILTTALLGLATLYFLVPVWWLVVASTKTTGSLFASPSLWFTGPFNLVTNLHNMATYDGGIFFRWLLNSFIYSGASALGATLFGAMCGYAIAKFEFRGRKALFATILGGVLVPPTVLALPLYLVFSAVHLTNSYAAVILPGLVSPIGVYLCRIYAQSSVPDPLMDAARVDGANESRIFTTIAARMMAPVLVTVFAFQFVSVWNNFLLPLIMLDKGTLFPVIVGLNQWNQQASCACGAPPFLYSMLVTSALVSLIPLILGFFCLQRYIRPGFSAGALRD